MKRWLVPMAIAGLLLPVVAASAELGESEILQRIDDLYRGDSARGAMVMKIVTKHYTRELGMEFWSKGKDKSLMRIRSPLKEQGTATLKAGENIWNYLPKVKRVIKVPSSMMGGAWMGSHFTNDDLVKESRMSEDFTCKKTFDGERDDERLAELTLTPKEGAAVVWGKVVVEVRVKDWMPLRVRYFDEDMALARTMTFSDFRVLGGRALPARMEIRPADEPEEYTELRYEQLQFDVSLDDDVFTLRNLQR